jgi:hypothetical protein
MEYDIHTSKDGIITYFVDNKLHREDGPAIIYPNGTKFWYKEGNNHREVGPAKVWVDGNEEWWLNGELHREDGPAGDYTKGSYGSCTWWLKGIRIYDEVENVNILHKYNNLSEKFKQSIIKYSLMGPEKGSI